MVKGFGGGKQGWIANLGHGLSNLLMLGKILTNRQLGITPNVDPEDLRFYFKEIHRLTSI